MNDLTNIRKITQIRPHKPVYAYSSSDKSTTLEFDKRYLYEKWNSRSSKGTKAYVLHDLSPKLVHWRHIGENSLSTLKWAGLFLLSALIIFYSDYQYKIPLLAPSMLIIGITMLLKALNDIRPRSWTYIYDDEGNFVTSLLIDNRESKERQQQRHSFETHLSKSIELAKQQEYYDYDWDSA